VTKSEDNRLVDYLYGELSEEEANAFERNLESDPALSAELSGLEGALGVLRSAGDVEPPPHLDSLILATARKTADELAEADQAGLLRWLRRMLQNPIAGIAAAGSVALIVAVVTVPSMMMTGDRASEGVAYESVPSPVVQSVPAAKPEIAAAPERDEFASGARSEPKASEVGRSGLAGPGPDELAFEDSSAADSVELEPAADPAPRPARTKKATARRAPRQEERARTVFTDDDLENDEGRRDALASAPPKEVAGPAKPAPKMEPQPPATAAPKAKTPLVEKLDRPGSGALAEAEAEEKDARYRVAAQAELKKESAGKDATDVDAREERGQAMLAAAKAEFTRNNPEGGRSILIRALEVTAGARVHAEIAFRIAQHDYERGAYVEAIYYARLAASDPRFPARDEARRIQVEAEERASQRKARELAPAAPASVDEVR
jgi:hypothetical protein